MHFILGIPYLNVSHFFLQIFTDLHMKLYHVMLLHMKAKIKYSHKGCILQAADRKAFGQLGLIYFYRAIIVLPRDKQRTEYSKYPRWSPNGSGITVTYCCLWQ